MFASGCGMLVSLLAMFVSRFSVILRLFLLAKIMMKGSLMMMMRRRMVMSGSLMMMLAGRMLGLCHVASSQPVSEGSLVVGTYESIVPAVAAMAQRVIPMNGAY